MAIVFHSNHCPRCKVLEAKLKQNNIGYIENNDTDVMLKLGLQSAPALEVDGELMDFSAAVKWINNRGERQ